MELEKVLHMKGGSGETSYAQTAYFAKRAISMTKPIRDEAIVELFGKDGRFQNQTRPLCIADLGCASGPNTFAVVSDLIATIENQRRKLNIPDLEYQVYLNDLMGNDFNTVFKSLPKFQKELKEQTRLLDGQFFITAMPGSFYGRLFPRQSLHFVHSSYSLYWLSQVPKGLEDNKRNIYMSRTSPESVVKAYKDQFQNDSQLFLRSRSVELIEGGKMVLTYWGRSSESPTSIENCFMWDILANVLNELIPEGIVDSKKLETFNFPVYHPSSADIIEEVRKEGSFCINKVEVSQIRVNDVEENDRNTPEESYKKSGKKGYLSTLLRSLLESVLESHFGKEVTHEVLRRSSSIIEDACIVSKQSVTNVTISLTKM